MRHDFVSYKHLCNLLLKTKRFRATRNIDNDTYVAYADLR